MNQTLNYILDNYPNVKKKINGQNVQLTNTEDVFFQLAKFVENPEQYSFNINLLYKFLENDDLIFALQTILYFFRNETYLIQDKESFIVQQKKERILNQTGFADYLKENGLNYYPAKIRVEYYRGKLPKPDIMINEKPHWYETTVKLFTQKKLEES